MRAYGRNLLLLFFSNIARCALFSGESGRPASGRYPGNRIFDSFRISPQTRPPCQGGKARGCVGPLLPFNSSLASVLRTSTHHQCCRCSVARCLELVWRRASIRPILDAGRSKATPKADCATTEFLGELALPSQACSLTLFCSCSSSRCQEYRILHASSAPPPKPGAGSCTWWRKRRLRLCEAIGPRTEPGAPKVSTVGPMTCF